MVIACCQQIRTTGAPMRLTTKGRYAVTAMLDLALHDEQGPVSLADISLRQQISLSYLEQLFARLRRAGLVNSTRGPGGGYGLGRADDQISIAEIVRAVSENYDATGCDTERSCTLDKVCLTHYLWHDLSSRIHEFLDGVSLRDLARRHEIQDIARRQDRRQHGDIQLSALN